ncbi:hypothetical protein [Thaumasiovibrio subtropicus]|uniref:hypothetical protein n=1 Tax=Thaumasiovibrio subtropicus TaxID=1891207 RepID=UPI00131BD98E|nr:hypothetical protein [Thaumasiovibrio subtropicus]
MDTKPVTLADTTHSGETAAVMIEISEHQHTDMALAPLIGATILIGLLMMYLGRKKSKVFTTLNS